MFFAFNWNNSYPSHLIWSLHDKYRVDTSFCANSHRNDYVTHCGNFHIRLTVLSVYWPLEVIRFLDAFNGDFNRLFFILIRITFEFVTDFWLIPPSIYPLNEGMCVCVCMTGVCLYVCEWRSICDINEEDFLCVEQRILSRRKTENNTRRERNTNWSTKWKIQLEFSTV